MYDYRLFYPQMSIDDLARDRKLSAGHPTQRVYRLAAERRANRSGRR